MVWLLAITISKLFSFDSILKQANITLESLPTFIEKLNKISEDAKIDFYLSVSADKAEIADVDTLGCTVL